MSIIYGLVLLIGLVNSILSAVSLILRVPVELMSFFFDLGEFFFEAGVEVSGAVA